MDPLKYVFERLSQHMQQGKAFEAKIIERNIEVRIKLRKNTMQT